MGACVAHFNSIALASRQCVLRGRGRFVFSVWTSNVCAVFVSGTNASKICDYASLMLTDGRPRSHVRGQGQSCWRKLLFMLWKQQWTRNHERMKPHMNIGGRVSVCVCDCVWFRLNELRNSIDDYSHSQVSDRFNNDVANNIFWRWKCLLALFLLFSSAEGEKTPKTACRTTRKIVVVPAICGCVRNIHIDLLSNDKAAF